MDLRLAGCAGAIWLVSLAGLYASTGTCALVATTAALLATALGWWLHRADVPAWRWAWLVVAVLLGVVCGAASTAARVAARDAQPLRDLARQHAPVQVEVTVTDDPRPVRGSGGGPRSYAVPVRLRALRAGGSEVRVPARVLVLASDPAWRALLPGTPVTASGRLAPARGGDLRAAVLSATGPPDAGAAPWAQRAAGGLRTGLRQACAGLPPGPRGLLPGLVDGDTSGLDPGVADDFRATGMTHLVAVSGANLAIVGGLVLALARWCRAGPRLCAVLCALAIAGFVILARPTPSVLRAAAMGALGLLALALGRSRAAVPGLAVAVALLVLIDPELAGDAGFALSVSATGGLLLLAPGWRDGLRRRRVPAGLAEALAVPAAAQVACAPVIAGLSGTVSMVAVPANLLAEPAVAPATVLGVLAAILSVPCAGAAAFVAWLGSWPARWLLLVAGHGAHAPSGVLPWPAGTAGALLLALLLAVALVAARRPVVRVLAAVCAVAAVLGAVPVAVVAPGWPPTRAVVVVCDVGQGDAVVLPVTADQAVVVDAGPEPVATDRCLRSLGVRVVVLLVVSHFHADHVGGVDGVYRGRRVAAVITSPFPEPVAGHDALLATAASHGTPVSVPAPGWTWRAGALLLTLLGPAHRLSGTDSDPNNNSLVLLASAAGRRVLLAGDAEVGEQADLLASLGPEALRVDVLKLAHHGSAKQDPAFLDAVRPAVALVSVGLGNSYGLPNPPVLERLRRAGALVLRTDLDGDLAATMDGNGLRVLRHGVAPGRRPP
ncbi:MAG: competence protein ComEC [Micromonosporaceae bacterium]